MLLFSRKLREKAYQTRYVINFVIFKETKRENISDKICYKFCYFQYETKSKITTEELCYKFVLFSRKLRAKHNR